MRWALVVPVVCGVVVLSLVAGCSGAPLPSLFPTFKADAEEEKAAEVHVDPPCKSANACTGVLKKLVSGKDRTWVGKSLPAEGYSDGTRLFAYRALRKKLTCPELDRAVDETDTARANLKGSSHAAVNSLMGKVNTELRAERTGRCRQKAKS